MPPQRYGFSAVLFWNRVSISTILAWNRVRVSWSVQHTPTQFFWKYPPRNFWSNFGSQKAGHFARRSLRRPWKLGLRIVAWSKPRRFCEESLGKIKFRAFPKRVGPRILSLESVDYFGTSEHYWVVENKKRRILISKIAMVGCCNFTVCKWVLWWACDLFSAIEMTCHERQQQRQKTINFTVDSLLTDTSIRRTPL